MTYDALNGERPKESLADKAKRLLEESKPRRFEVWRDVDVTEISGEGKVGEGVLFSDGWAVTHWLDRPPMNEPKTEVWHNPGTTPFVKISGHGGLTVLRWLDPEQPSSVQ